MNEIKFKPIVSRVRKEAKPKSGKRAMWRENWKSTPGSRKVSRVSMFKQMSPHRFRTIENFQCPFPYS